MKTVCVYCGSSPGRLADYAQGARALGQALLARGIGLVYGGAGIGLMGMVADSVLAGGGRVVGVIPQALARKEVAHAGLTELIVTASMHERKTRMAELADGFIALPGGIGTFEELFEIWTWAQLGMHAKPVGLLNVAGYYDALITFLNHAAQQQFMQPAQRELLMVASDPAALLERFASHKALVRQRWLAAEQT
ncbi:MAG: TIGR00730 family Rossman fold protein [Comamonadaceae bacterium CG12_big_fil_rev_8_21_14_0_65_59_15]|nr:MAG: TIGR00730 family Rossman fold protein [Comamonadaceae bacterium CG12_big_fil_rev_8_21_14_0_65_59_15]